MSILVNKDTRIIVQGITGGQGAFHTEQMINYGANVVAGVVPGKGGLDYVNSTATSGVVGQLYGLNVIVNSYIPKTRFGVFDMSVKPVAYVERRGLTVEEANPGFGITGSYMSMRYGLKVIRPEAGVIFIGS